MVATVNPNTFREEHPEFCDSVRVPGLGEPPPTDGAVPFEGDLGAFAPAERNPEALPALLKKGPEAIGFYRSFRLADDWGIYLWRGSLAALKEEFHRIIMRDLKGYMDRPDGYEGPSIDDLVAKIEYSLAMDFLLSHLRFHESVDLAAAQREIETGVPTYAPYQERYFAEMANPPKDPRLIGNLEECLANFEGFRNFMNPTYTDAISKIVEGALEERNASEWRAFFIGGRWGVEIANMLSRQPPGYRDVTKLCLRRTSVGSTNYVRVMFMPDPDARDRRQVELSSKIVGREVAESLLPETTPDPPLYLL